MHAKVNQGVTGDDLMPRILYIEDDASIAALFKVVVEANGHAVDIACDAAEGLAKQAASPYDAIAVDYQLPDMTGIDICRKLLLDDPDVPIVMITGMGDQRLAAEALGLGVMNYVQKDSAQVFLELLPSIIIQLLRKGNERRERARLKVELERSEARYRNASRMARMGHWTWDQTANRMAHCSPELASIFGVTPDEYLARSSSPDDDFTWYHPDDRENYKAVVKSAEKNKTGYDVTCRIVTGSGEIRYIRELASVTLGGNGDLLETAGVTQDITDLKQAELTAVSDREKMNAIIGNAVEGIITISRDGTIQTYNKAAESIFGYAADVTIGQNIKILMPEDVAARHDAYLSHYLETGIARIIGVGREVEGLRRDGTRFPMFLSISRNDLDGEITFTGMVRDLTEERSAEEEAKRQNQRMEDASRIAKLGFWEWSVVEERNTYLSPELISILGYTPDTLPEIIRSAEGESLYVHPDDLARYQKITHGIADASAGSYDIEFRLVRPDGEVRHIRQIARVERDANGEAVSVFGVDQDVTEQHKAQRELAESEARLNAFFQHSPYEVFMKDSEGRFQMVNVRFLRAHGVAEKDVLGKRPDEFYAAEEAESASRQDRMVLETGRASEEESVVRRTDGLHHLLTVKFPIRDEQDNVTGIGAVGVDITSQKKIEEALRESEERFRDYSEIGNDWHWELDEDLCYVELSPSGASSELYPSSRYLGLSRTDVKPDGMDDAAWLAHIDDLKAQRPFRNFVQPRHLSDGTTIWLSVSGKPIYGRDGAFLGYRGTATDITRQKKNEDALLSAQQLAKTGSWRYAPDRDVVIDCSEEMARLHGYTRAEFLDLFTEPGACYKTLIYPEDRERYYKILADAVESRKDWETEFRIVRKGGDVRHMKEHGVVELDADGEVVFMSGSLQDITDQKAAAEELEKAKAAAEVANLAKSDFLSSMSHELRTPLNAILGFSQLMEYNPQEKLTPSQQSSVDHIKKGGEHLLTLINDILDLARIEAGKTELSIEDVSIGDIIGESLALVKTLAEKRDIKITTRDKPDAYLVRADSTRLTQVILNLLSNAIKYNREAGRITIGLKATADGFLRISVTDTGPGIPEERYDELFQPFSRLGAEATDVEGTGIGLVVTKELIDLMGGRIGFESSMGVGSTFWVELALSSATALAHEGGGADPAENALNELPAISGKILYVEDNPANLALMEQIIANIDGLSIISAHNAEFGIELAKSQKPNLIILDINLPGMSGLEAIEKLKKIDGVSQIPVIALSAAATQKDIRKGLDAGFDHYLTKPINVLEITETIRNILAPSEI